MGYHTKGGVNSLTGEVSGVSLYKLKARFEKKSKFMRVYLLNAKILGLFAQTAKEKAHGLLSKSARFAQAFISILGLDLS